MIFNALSWNMRGSRSKEKARSLRRQVRKHRPWVVALQETKREEMVDGFKKFLWGNKPCKWVEVPSIGRSGGILTLYDPDILEAEETLVGAYSLSIVFRVKKTNFKWVFTNIYAPVDYNEKPDFWGELSAIGVLWKLPWLVGGDFNSTRSRCEKSGRRSGHNDSRRFNDFVDEYKMIEFQEEGPKFTYSNHQTPPALSRIDRFMANLEWLAEFRDHSERKMGYYKSDHRMLLLSQSVRLKGPKPFRFEPHWFESKELFKKIEKWWEEERVEGNPGFVISKKLKAIKGKIKSWVKDEYGKFEDRISKEEKTLQELDLKEEEDSSLDEVDRERRHQARLLLQNALREEEGFWSKKARKHWRLKGDRCTKYFHMIVNNRSNVNRIASLQVEGKRVEDQEEIAQKFVDFYTNLYEEIQDERPKIGELALKSLNLEKADHLERNFSEEEVYATMQDLAKEKTPGPDGFPIRFYIQCWHFMKGEIMEILRELQDNQFINWRLNNSFITLVPKIEGEKTVGDYRPISLISGIYKIISKVLASRLKTVMPELVSEFQSAGIEGRQVQEGVLVANELLDSQIRSKKPGTIFKLDFLKAFDHVSWNFCLDVLGRYGFKSKWIGWIKACLHSSHSSVLVNGRVNGHFKGSRGLKQGDPLSPMLFVLMVEVLTQLILKAQEEGLIEGWQTKQGGMRVPILQYADDTLIMMEGGKENALNLKAVVQWFSALSGLEINFNKSVMYEVNEVADWEEIMEEWECKKGELPDTYLGLPLGARYKSRAVWD
ncbi:hypothetical protein ACHQM5_017730 [Ranunculus cassubicifolius]